MPQAGKGERYIRRYSCGTRETDNVWSRLINSPTHTPRCWFSSSTPPQAPPGQEPAPPQTTAASPSPAAAEEGGRRTAMAQRGLLCLLLMVSAFLTMVVPQLHPSLRAP